MRARGVLLLLPLSWAISCGGRYLEPGDSTYDVGGSSSKGGSAQAQAGKGNSGAKAGSGSKGGSSTMGVGGACACDPIACAVGYVQVENSNGCCFHCELDVSTCADARQDYIRFRQQLIDKYSTIPCAVASDCSIYYESNRCGSYCGIAIPTALIKDLDANLTSYADATCSADCPPLPTPPCAPSAGPLCLDGVCR